MTEAEATPMQASLRHLKYRGLIVIALGWRVGRILFFYTQIWLDLYLHTVDEFIQLDVFEAHFCLGDYDWREAFRSVQ